MKAWGLPLSWRWMDGDAPRGYEALRVDGIEWAEDRNRGEYAAQYNGRWYSVGEATRRGWIRAVDNTGDTTAPETENRG